MLLQTGGEVQQLATPFTKKFIRRPDLTPYTRLHISYTALTAQLYGWWGAITDLSNQFNVSRTFIYDSAASFKSAVSGLFSPPVKTLVNDKKDSCEMLVSLRLEGRCSIEAISTIMKRQGLNLSSVGSISQIGQYFGSLLPNTLQSENNIQLVVFLSDEIFAKNDPILITVEPQSSAILKIELAERRRAEEWKKHWQCLEENGYCATYLVTDEGVGLCAASNDVFPGILRQPDTYHAIAHQLGQWQERLERSAYKEIEEEYKREKALDSARSDEVIAKRITRYEEAKKKADEAIEFYENFCYLYRCIINELKPFDSSGNLHDRQQAEENIKAGLILIESLENKKINKAINKVKRTLPELLNYFDTAQVITSELEKLPIGQKALRALCLAWQWNKAKIKAKDTNRRWWSADQERFCLEFAEGYLQEDYDVVKEQIYKELDKIVQSSALVECINSIIRPYLNNAKGNVTQEALNLIMFYHNHRRYKAGKRKGKTPMEILTGNTQEKDWIELLFERVEEKDPEFFSVSR